MASPRTEVRIGGAVPRFSWGTNLAVLVFLGLAGWSAYGVGFDLVELLRGTGPIERFVSGMFPPDLSAATLRATLVGLLETFQMSLLGVLLGALIAFPLGALGTAGGAGRGRLARRGAGAGRPLPPLAPRPERFPLRPGHPVSARLRGGPGPFPGTLALAVHSAGVLGKLYSETLEAVPERPVEALRSAGAGGLQALLFGRLPQAAGGFASLTLYQWECNMRSATILGFVGAGGIGQEILLSMNLFDYPKVATLVAATVLVVLAVDRFSAAVRRRLL